MPESEMPAGNLIELAGRIASRMRLNEINLISSKLLRQPVFVNEAEAALRCEFGFKVDHGYVAAQKRLAAMIHFFADGRVKQGQEDERQLFKVEAAFAAIYVVDGDDPIDDATLEAFAQMNGVYNCWPYWREFLQSSTTRMGITPVTLPLITGHRIEEILRKRTENLVAREVELTAPSLRMPDIAQSEK